MEIYVNKAGNLVSVEGMKGVKEGVNLTVKISKGNKSETRKMCMKELNSLLYNGSYNLTVTGRRAKPFCKDVCSPIICFNYFKGKEVVFNRGGQQFTGWLVGHDPNNASFVVRTGAEWGYRLTYLNPNVAYVNGVTNINCRMADVPYNDIIFL